MAADWRRMRVGALAGTSLLALSMTATAQAQDGHGFYGFVQGGFVWGMGDPLPLYTPRGTNYFCADVACAILGGPVATYFGVDQALDSGHTGRAGAGIHFGNGWRFGAAVGGGGLNGNGSVILPQSDPAFPFIQDEFQTEADLDYVTIDLEVGRDIGFGGGSTLEVFGGLRGLFTESRASYSYDFVGTASIVHEKGTTGSEFAGFGPRLGANLAVPLPHGLTFLASAAGSVLFGELETTGSYSLYSAFVFTSPTTIERSRSDTQHETVFNASAEIALSLDLDGTPAPRAAFEFGYSVEYWWNAIGGITQPIGSSPGFGAFPPTSGVPSQTISGLDFGTHGPFLRLTFGLN